MKCPTRAQVLLNATTRIDTDGEIVGVVGVGQDITEIKQSQAEMSQIAADLKMLIETANAPIFGIDASGLVNEWNRKAMEVACLTLTLTLALASHKRSR